LLACDDVLLLQFLLVQPSTCHPSLSSPAAKLTNYLTCARPHSSPAVVPRAAGTCRSKL
jgi:hypothetical protein